MAGFFICCYNHNFITIPQYFIYLIVFLYWSLVLAPVFPNSNIMKRVTILLLTSCCIFFSCNKEDHFAGVEVRIHNATPVQIEKLVILNAGGEVVFDMLAPRFTTGYRAVAATPENLACIMEAGGGRQQMLTGEGVNMIYKGYYTCKLIYDTDAQLSMQLIKD